MVGAARPRAAHGGGKGGARDAAGAGGRMTVRAAVERIDYVEAQDDYVCFKADGRDVETLNMLAQAFHGLGQTAKTISVYKELAKVYQERGRHQDARVEREKEHRQRSHRALARSPRG